MNQNTFVKKVGGIDEAIEVEYTLNQPQVLPNETKY